MTGTQALRDTLAFMQRSKKIIQISKKKRNGDVFWNIILIILLGENRFIVKNDEEYDITPDSQKKVHYYKRHH